MGMSTGGPQGGIKSDINVTPLVDVVLVLLIIFMVVTPMLQNGKAVQLPKASKAEEGKKDSDPIYLSVTPDKKYFLDKEEMADKPLEEALRAELGKAPNRKILLKGDTTLEVGEVRKVMEITRRANAQKVFLGVEELKN